MMLQCLQVIISSASNVLKEIKKQNKTKQNKTKKNKTKTKEFG